MGIYGDLQKLNQAHKQPQAALPPSAAHEAVSPVPKPLETKKPTQRNPASRRDSQPASMLSRYHASLIEALRKAVKFVGKEAFFGRFTPEEKRLLADAAYAYKRRGFKTSENEITRIAVNFILQDQQANGENSILEQVLKALNE
jgi:hypothetical protein